LNIWIYNPYFALNILVKRSVIATLILLREGEKKIEKKFVRLKRMNYFCGYDKKLLVG